MQTDFKFLFLFSWFAASIITFFGSMAGFVFLLQEPSVSYVSENFNLYAALPNQNGVVSESITSSDGRPRIIETFFKKIKQNIFIHVRSITT